MMIRAEVFYNRNIRGKNATQIMTIIQELKQRIERLKDIMEHPKYRPRIHPDEATQLSATRAYLERAKQALVDVGGTYTPSEAELKAAEFEANIPYISKVELSIGGFHDGYKTKTYIVGEDDVQVYTKHSLASKNANDDNVETIKTKYFLDDFKYLRIGEWRKRYDTERFGMRVYDGTQWSLVIEFSNGHETVKIQGDNAYPYNFKEFVHAFKTT